MKQESFNKFEEKGIGLPFAVSKSGETMVSQSGESLKSKLAQVGTVIFETIGAVGRVKIDTLEIIGDAKSVVMDFDDENLLGSLFEPKDGTVISEIVDSLKTLKVEPHVEALVKHEEAPKPALTINVLDDIKAMLKEYVGDFADRIYQNQIKAQRIKTDDLHEEDARRLIFALGKAAGMIIGPSKGKELTNKLLAKLK
ncbi:MAG TPA: hypothetical protein VF399_03675 [bacterium]